MIRPFGIALATAAAILATSALAKPAEERLSLSLAGRTGIPFAPRRLRGAG